MTGFLSRTIEGLFLSTDRQRYWSPEHFGLTGREILSPAPDGSRVSTLVIDPAEGKPAGTVLYLHPGSHNRGFHLPQVAWLAAAGWRVLVPDYRGSGASEGSLRPDLLHEDAEAAAAAADVRPGELIVFGQGAGAHAALRFAARNPVLCRGLVLESLYATRRGWLIHRYGPGIGHLCAALLESETPEPAELLSRTGIPTALLHAERDAWLPAAEHRALLRHIPANCTCWEAPGAKTSEPFMAPGIWREKFLCFARSALAA
ncbi:alpha/beta hydrolase [Sutterella sp.]|uniref:alpha/beta hydrolase n=1 Tax=Sutterella sp. TaxID=1981025 RepID=UPI0026DF76CD|nr:alpha/beta hydrolase [Sutterella sp.]MDO5530877.1 alpha/beta hydrolase [Sutterella sp.]